jgi:hypothetical protein
MCFLQVSVEPGEFIDKLSLPEYQGEIISADYGVLALRKYSSEIEWATKILESAPVGTKLPCHFAGRRLIYQEITEEGGTAIGPPVKLQNSYIKLRSGLYLARRGATVGKGGKSRVKLVVKVGLGQGAASALPETLGGLFVVRRLREKSREFGYEAHLNTIELGVQTNIVKSLLVSEGLSYHFGGATLTVNNPKTQFIRLYSKQLTKDLPKPFELLCAI